jgi:hypothetical protein
VASVRSGRWFDPALVGVLLVEARECGFWKNLLRKNADQEVARLEPPDRVFEATPERVDLVASAFGEIIGAKSPFTYRHSEGGRGDRGSRRRRVGSEAGPDAGLAPARHRQARHLQPHTGEGGRPHRGDVRNDQASPKLTHDILSRVGPFRPIAETAANHHEKLDGSGYHRGVGAEHLGLPSRGLAVADIYDALSAARPYHVALPQERVLAMLRDDGGSKLDAECVALAGDLAARDEI